MHEAELRRLPPYQQERLLHRNWKVGSIARHVVHRSSFQIVDAVSLGHHTVRCRDKAGRREGAVYTAEVKMERAPRIGPVYVLNVVRASGQAIRDRVTADGLRKIFRKRQPKQSKRQSLRFRN